MMLCGDFDVMMCGAVRDALCGDLLLLLLFCVFFCFGVWLFLFVWGGDVGVLRF